VWTEDAYQAGAFPSRSAFEEEEKDNAYVDDHLPPWGEISQQTFDTLHDKDRSRAHRLVSKDSFRDRDSLRQAFLFQEVLGSPVSLRDDHLGRF
jgi:hypothetical protein